MIKKILGMFLFIGLILPATFVFAAGQTPAGHTAITDIQTVIYAYNDWRPILCYHFDDTIYVRAEDLAKYQFNVDMDNNANKLTLTLLPLTNSKPDSPYTYPDVQTIKAAVSVSLPVYSTSTTVIFEGIPLYNADHSRELSVFNDQQVTAYMIDGQIVVPISVMEKVNGVWPSFNYDARKLSIWFIRPSDPDEWGAVVSNPNYNSDLFQMKGPAAFQLESNGQNWQMIETSGDWTALDRMWISDTSLMFLSHTYIDFEYKDQLMACSNFTNQKRISADTPAQRDALAKIMRVYINGDQVGGELGYVRDESLGNGMEYDFYFYFDRIYTNDEIKSVRVEFGSFGK